MVCLSPVHRSTRNPSNSPRCSHHDRPKCLLVVSTATTQAHHRSSASMSPHLLLPPCGFCCRHVRDDPYSYLHGINNLTWIDVNTCIDKRDANGCLDYSQLSTALLSGSANITRLASIEGANEIDLLMFSKCDSMSDWWYVFDAGWQAAMYNLVQAAGNGTNLQNVTLVAPSIGWGTAPGHPRPLCAQGDSSAYCSVGNMHSYPGGWMPSTSLQQNIQNNAKVVAGADKPVWATETGYHTAVNYNGTAQWGVDEYTMGKYMPRLFLLYHANGVKRTFSYELLDQWADPNMTNPEANFGLVRFNYTYKPAASHLKTLISLLAEPNYPPFTPVPQNIVIDDPSNTVSSTLLAKSDGRFYLALWREVNSWNVTTMTRIPIQPVNVTLTLPAATRAAKNGVDDVANGGLKLPAGTSSGSLRSGSIGDGHRSLRSGDFTSGNLYQISNDSTNPVQTFDPLPSQLTLAVPDEVLLLELMPQLQG